jgi:fucose 4-O-acetylase-like acetyltransferase
MPVMFFVSGYFGIMSLSRHGGQKFWQGKFRRIILPWLFGSAFIAPLIAYITLAMRLSHDIRLLFWAYPLTWTISAAIFWLYYKRSPMLEPLKES